MRQLVRTEVSEFPREIQEEIADIGEYYTIGERVGVIASSK